MGNWNRNFNRRHQEKQAAARNRGGDFLPWEMQQMSFEVGETFYARFLRPEDGNVYVRAFHWPQGGPPYACTRDHSLFDGKCVFCETYPNKEDRGKRKTRDVLEVIDFRYFHVVPHPTKQDKNTIEACRHHEPEPRNNRCHSCNSGDEKRSVRHFGGHKVVELNNDQYNQIYSAHDKLSHTCIAFIGDKMCGAENYPIAFICEHCGDTMVSEEDIRATPEKQVQAYVNNRQKCQKCGVEDWPYAIFGCDNGGRSPTPEEVAKGVHPKEGSHWVVQGSMFDQVLEITVAGEEKKIGNNLVTLKNLNIGTSKDGWSRIADDLQPFGFDDEQIAKLCEPWNLHDRYRPMFLKRDEYGSDEEYVAAVLDKQAEACGRPNPFSSGGPRRGFGGGSGARSFRS